MLGATNSRTHLLWRWKKIGDGAESEALGSMPLRAGSGPANVDAEPALQVLLTVCEHMDECPVVAMARNLP